MLRERAHLTLQHAIYLNSFVGGSFFQSLFGLLNPGQRVLLQFSAVSFSVEVDVASVADDGLGLVSSLRHTGRLRERVGTNRGTTIEVLSGEVLSPDGRGLLHSVVALRDLLQYLIIRLLLATSPGAVLNDQLLVLVSDRHVLLVLGPHDATANRVLVHVLVVVSRLVSGLEESELLLGLLTGLLLGNFGGNLSHNLKANKSYEKRSHENE